ncbi:5'/3'-nucleotidase SurE [Novosphingobium mathurense]|uniref:5'-nucleotidase n=1 Tax=Novosphingobium mathurense TaxID=428990 RepID=A0A1U6HXE5_9SPHN|nr:5'/3'-nucleotidase SurE [Novosphingobium mathurense]SLK00455.1 5'-nucleotidase [Novosphingobium mathurense]
MLTRLLLATALVAAPALAEARNIVVSNDDGLTSNVVALYKALKAEGHDVIVSIPCTGQSGMGGAVKFMRPLGPLSQDCHNGAAKKGAPGVGPIDREGIPAQDFNYVDGTPVMAVLYGIDVLAQKRWAKAPDLVLSGPNEGQNVGQIIVSSGTVNVVQYASARGIPAVALSAGVGTTDNTGLANPQSATVAALSAELVDALDAGAAGRSLLPAGISLNVNFPDDLAKDSWKLTRVGTYNAYDVHFTEDMSQSPVARAMGAGGQSLPGVVIDLNKAAPTPAQARDESIVVRDAITVSVMQPGYGAQDKHTTGIARKLINRLSGKK